MSTLNISLPEEMRAFIDRQLAEGGFSTASEYIRHLIRTAQRAKEKARLERLLLEGLESGDAVPVDKQFWSELVAEAAERYGKRHDPEG